MKLLYYHASATTVLLVKTGHTAKRRGWHDFRSGSCFTLTVLPTIFQKSQDTK